MSVQIGDVTRVSGPLGRFWIIDELPPAEPTISEILSQVAAKHRVALIDLRSDRRTKRIAAARGEVYYRCATETRHSFPAIGRVINRDGTSVYYGAHRYAQQNGLPLGDREAVIHRRFGRGGC